MESYNIYACLFLVLNVVLRFIPVSVRIGSLSHFITE